MKQVKRNRMCRLTGYDADSGYVVFDFPNYLLIHSLHSGPPFEPDRLVVDDTVWQVVRVEGEFGRQVAIQVRRVPR